MQCAVWLCTAPTSDSDPANQVECSVISPTSKPGPVDKCAQQYISSIHAAISNFPTGPTDCVLCTPALCRCPLDAGSRLMLAASRLSILVGAEPRLLDLRGMGGGGSGGNGVFAVSVMMSETMRVGCSVLVW